MKKSGLSYFFAAFILLYSFSSSHAMERCFDQSDEKQATIKPRILIVGAGIGGLTLANTLKKHNIPFDLIEKKPSWEHTGAGIAIPANATWVLQQLGFDTEINTKTQHIKAMSFTTDQDELVVREDLTEIHNAGAQFVSIHRASLHAMLFERVKDFEVRMGTFVKTISQNEDTGEIDVEFSDTSRKTYDLVVGADGMHSSIRQKIFGTDSLSYQGIKVWRTVVDTPEGLDHPIYMQGEDTLFLLYPLSNNKTNIYCHHIDPSQDKDVVENRISKLRVLFGNYKGFVPQVINQINDPHQIVPGQLKSVPEVKWFKGNVVLIGDASHVCTPMLQQGGALAIEDGWVLGEEINCGLSRNESIVQILTNFVNRRDKRVRFIVQESDKVGNGFIKQNEAQNVTMFKILMKENP